MSLIQPTLFDSLSDTAEPEPEITPQAVVADVATSGDDDTFALTAAPLKAAPRLSNRIVRLFSPHHRRHRRLVVSDHIPYLNFEQRVTKQQYRSRRKKLETGRGTGRKPKKYKNKPPELAENEIERACAEIQSRWTPTERAKRAAGQVPDRLRFDTPVALGSHH